MAMFATGAPLLAFPGRPLPCESWTDAPADSAIQPLQIGQVAHLLGVTIDILRNWDRNGLINVPRDPSNGYRRYGAQEISRLRVIRMLSRSGYSLSQIYLPWRSDDCSNHYSRRSAA